MLGRLSALSAHLASNMRKLTLYPFSLRLRWAQTSQLGASLAHDDPNMAQHGATWPQHGPNLGGSGGVLELTFGGHFWLLGPSWGQDGPTSLPGAFRERFLMVLAANLVDFEPQL